MIGLRRREEQALLGVAQAPLVAGIPGNVILRGDRQDGARDQVPVIVQLEGNNRLALT